MKNGYKLDISQSLALSEHCTGTTLRSINYLEKKGIIIEYLIMTARGHAP